MISALNIAQTGLNASKYAVENVANNITNESTPGYKKRVVNFNELNNLSDLPGQGVSFSLTRITSEFLYSNLVTETSKFAYNEEVSQILENAEALFAETEDSGFSANLNRYYQAVENLRSEPSNEIYQTDLANNGKFLVESLQKLYDGIERIEIVKEEELKANIDKVNGILADIGKINEQMSDYDETSIELLDKRDNLEAELAKYVDVEVTNFDNEYELKIAGQTAVRYSTNIRSISLDTEVVSQVDRFSLVDDEGVIYDSLSNYKDDSGNIVPKNYIDGDVITYNFNAEQSVSVTIGQDITGLDWDGNEVTFTVTADNLVRSMAFAINNDDSIRQQITAFNGNPEYNKDGDLVEPSKDKFLVIQSDKDGIEGSFESRISFERVDSVSADITRENFYKNEITSTEALERNSLSIFGSEVNLNSGIIKAQIEYTDSSSSLNKLQDFKDQLDLFANSLSDIGSSFYRDNISGEYIYGVKASDQLNQVNLNPTKFEIDLSSISDVDGNLTTNITSIDFEFDLDNDGIPELQTIPFTTPPTSLSDLASQIQTVIGDQDVTVEVDSNGKLIISDDLKREFTTTSFDILDDTTPTALSIASVTANAPAIEVDYDYNEFKIELFSGSDVKSLSFNSEMINDLDQTDLDYLASLQWKSDVSFTKEAQNPNDNDSVSFSEFYQSIRVSVSSQKESADFVLTTQTEVKQSLEATYESIVRVDKDEEMTALIQFQAAYTASAKVITVVDEMLQTLLGIKR